MAHQVVPCEVSRLDCLVLLKEDHLHVDLSLPKKAFLGRVLAYWHYSTGEQVERPNPVDWWGLVLPGMWLYGINMSKPRTRPVKVTKRRGTLLFCVPQSVVDSTGTLGDWNNYGMLIRTMQDFSDE